MTTFILGLVFLLQVFLFLLCCGNFNTAKRTDDNIRELVQGVNNLSKKLSERILN